MAGSDTESVVDLGDLETPVDSPSNASRGMAKSGTLGLDDGTARYKAGFYRGGGLIRTPSGRWRKQRTLRPGSKWRKLQLVLRTISTLKANHASALLYGGTPVSRSDAWQDRILRARLVGSKPWWVLLPDHWLVLMWQPLMFLPLMYVALITPYRIFFSQPDTTPWLVAEYLVWTSFIVDMIMSFVSAYEDEQAEEIIVQPDLIAWRYFKSWFFVDLVASIPFDLIFPSEDPGAASANRLSRLARLGRSARILRLLRLFRLLRVVRLQGYLSRFEDLTDLHPAIARALGACFWIALSLHFLACLWFFIGSEQEGDNWIIAADLNTDSDLHMYIAALYWVSTTITSVGYGDIIPISDGERMFTVFVQLMGVAWTGLVVSSMATIQASLDREHSTTKTHRRQLEYFVRDARLPRSLKSRVLASFQHAENDASRASAQHTAAILDMLAPSVRKEVVLFTNRKLLRQLPPLQREADEVQAFVVERLVRLHVSRGDFVCVEHTFATHMFWMARGRVNLFSDTERVTSYGSGSFFGVADVLFSPLRVASVQAVSDCELYSLSREDLQVVCSEFEDFGRRMRRVALKRLKRYAEVLGRPLVPAEYLRRMMELGVSVGLTAEEVSQYAEATSLGNILTANPSILPSASFRIGAVSSSAAEQMTLDPRAFVGDIPVRSTRTLLDGRETHVQRTAAAQAAAAAASTVDLSSPPNGLSRQGSRVLTDQPRGYNRRRSLSVGDGEGGLGGELQVIPMSSPGGHGIPTPRSTSQRITRSPSGRAGVGLPLSPLSGEMDAAARQLAQAEAAARVMSLGAVGSSGSGSGGGWTPALLQAVSTPAAPTPPLPKSPTDSQDSGEMAEAQDSKEGRRQSGAEPSRSVRFTGSGRHGRTRSRGSRGRRRGAPSSPLVSGYKSDEEGEPPSPRRRRAHSWSSHDTDSVDYGDVASPLPRGEGAAWAAGARPPTWTATAELLSPGSGMASQVAALHQMVATLAATQAQTQATLASLPRQVAALTGREFSPRAAVEVAPPPILPPQ